MPSSAEVEIADQEEDSDEDLIFYDPVAEARLQKENKLLEM